MKTEFSHGKKSSKQKQLYNASNNKNNIESYTNFLLHIKKKELLSKNFLTTNMTLFPAFMYKKYRILKKKCIMK